MAGIPVRIAVVFEPDKKARPIWFELNRRKHLVKETTYHWRDKIGEIPLLHYAVTADDALYELVFNTVDQSWTARMHEIE
ncbi:MAG TPA: hypothetical protein VN642_12710 [Dongiaceae bacterium]|nr:hypothetical protein [Dongiaceae bacterium]